MKVIEGWSRTDLVGILLYKATAIPILGRSYRIARTTTRRGKPVCTKIEERSMAWVILFIAGLFEVGWAIGLKYTEGFTRLWPTVGTVAAMIISLWLLGIAMKSLPVGTSYAVWVGVGAVGTVILGIILLGEAANAARLISVAFIIAGIIGLKLATPA
jgi:quaternary ammonium compound-resistance protein SugE